MTDWSETNDKYFSESLSQVIQGDVPALVSEILDGTVVLTVVQRYSTYRNNVTYPYTVFSNEGVTVGETVPEVDSVPWSFNTKGILDLMVGDVVTVEFKTEERRRVNNGISYTLTESSVVSVVFEVISEDELEGSVEIPTGVMIKRSQDSIKMLVPEASLNLGANAEFVGVNFLMSLTAGGGSNGYQRLNPSYVNTVDTSETVETVLVVNNYENIIEGLNVTTTETRQDRVNYYTYTINPTVLNRMVQQGDIPNIFLSDGVSLDPSTSYYLIATFVVYDNVLSQVIESNYSIEIEGKFLEYSVDYSGLPERTQNDVISSINRRLISNNKAVNVISGSVIRDMLDPISLEFEKYYVVQDFVFKSLSIDSLIAFDDADGDGISDPLQSSVGKLRLADALGFRSATNFQSFIDEQFDKLGSNYNVFRKGSVRATGSVIFYTSNNFNSDILISNGSILTAPSDPDTGRSAVTFRVVGTYILEADNKSYYYNSKLKRYEIEASIEASYAGSSGNVPAGSITMSSGLNPALEVENLVPTDFGEDRENNRNLSNRIKMGIISYDSGTEGGYASAAQSVPGITESRIEKTGDPLMMRDFDASSNKHVGGKVDVYIKGDRKAQIIDQVSFSYSYPADVTGASVSERFDVTNASEFRLRCRNPKVSSSSPLVFVSSVRNVTRGRDYDITGLSIVGENDTIILNNTSTNQAIGLASFDVVTVNYKYRTSSLLKLSNQPVSDIISIVDAQGNVIDDSFYRLVKREDPLDKGFSNIASDSVEFLFNQAQDFEEFLIVTDEQHDLFYNVEVALSNKGVDISTIVVSDPEDPSVVYQKDIDYLVITGSEVSRTSLVLKTGSMIRQGGRVSVDYTAAQNFLVTYTYNSLINSVAEKISKTKHACADVAVKTAIGNFVDFSFQVIRSPGVSTSRLKSRIQTTLANVIGNLKMGERLSQGTVLSTIKSTSGVKDIVIPMVRMMKRNGSFISSDTLGLLPFEVYNRTNSFGIVSYRTINPVLSYKTQDNGGPDNMFRTVYEDSVALTLVKDPSDVHKESGQAYIQADGRIVVSTLDGAPPHNKKYSAAYYVYYGNNENVVGDIEVGQTEYIRVDSVSLADIEIIDAKVVKRGL
jgi:uncharacterized phage protein gp47/JayE